MFGRQAAPAEQQALAALGHEAAPGHLVPVVQQPLHARLAAGMQLDGPGRARHAVGELAAAHHVLVAQRRQAACLAGLAHAHLHRGVVDPARLAAGQLVLEEAGVLAHLVAALDLGLGEVVGVDAVELASVGAAHARAVAQQFAGTRGLEQPDLLARQGVTGVGRGGDQRRDLGRHDGVAAVGRLETRHVDALQAEDHRRVLHHAVGTAVGLEAGHRHQVGIAAGVDGEAGAHVEQAALGPHRRAVDAVAVAVHADRQRVVRELHAGRGQQRIGRFAPRQRLVHPGPGLAVEHRLGQSAALLHRGDEVVDEAVHDLLRSPRRLLGFVKSADGARQARHRAAAAEAVALHQQGLQPGAGRDGCRGHAGGAAADHEHVDLDTLTRSRIHRHHLICIATLGSHVTSCGHISVQASVMTCSAMKGIIPQYMCRIVISGGATARR